MSKIISNAKLHLFSGVITHLHFILTASKTMWLLCSGSLTHPRKLRRTSTSLAHNNIVFSAAEKSAGEL